MVAEVFMWLRAKDKCDVVMYTAMYHTGEVEHIIKVFQSTKVSTWRMTEGNIAGHSLQKGWC